MELFETTWQRNRLADLDALEERAKTELPPMLHALLHYHTLYSLRRQVETLDIAKHRNGSHMHVEKSIKEVGKTLDQVRATATGATEAVA